MSDWFANAGRSLILKRAWDVIAAEIAKAESPIVGEITPAMTKRAHRAYFDCNPARMTHDERLNAAIAAALNIKVTK